MIVVAGREGGEDHDKLLEYDGSVASPCGGVVRINYQPYWTLVRVTARHLKADMHVHVNRPR
jgi:hypothetical protein